MGMASPITQFFRKNKSLLIYLLVVLLLVIWIYFGLQSSRGFSTPVTSSLGYSCDYNDRAKEEFAGWLSQNGFDQVDNLPIPWAGMHDSRETQDWYTWYKGSYQDSSEFYLYLVYDDTDRGQEEYEYCDIRISLKYRAQDFSWVLEQDVQKIDLFTEKVRNWWRDYHFENPT
jgi:hypothetical protein